MAEQKEEQIKFYSNKVCPFAHRAWLTLELKKIPYEFIQCNLKEKEEHFKEAYAKALGHNEGNEGKVPIILHKGKYIAESAVVARYLDYEFSDEDKYGPSLLPSDGYQRAAVEILVAWFGDSGWLKFHYGILMQPVQEEADKQAEEWKKKWKILNDRLSLFTDKGTFLPDGRISLFEVAVFPFFERLITIQHYLKYEIYTKWFDEFPRIKSWYNTLLENEAIKKVLSKQEFLVDGYKHYREKALAKYKEEQEKKAKEEQAAKENK